MSDVDTSAEALAETCRELRLLAVGLTAQFPQHARLNMFDPQIAQIEALAAERDELMRGTGEQARLITEILADRDRLAAENARMRAALSDLMTWFPNKPSPPEWRLPGGEYGADAAVAAARAALTGDTLHD